uniref:Xin actin binding repeat containing 1 n=1 Tax=Ficedula albicollis TaxID=59894 RepID=A0A803W4Y9_FICAL
MGPKHHSHPGSISAMKEMGIFIFFSLNRESVVLSFGGPLGEQCQRPGRDRKAMLALLSSAARGSPHTSVPLPDDRARSFLDPAGSTGLTAQRGGGRLCAPSVKELSALFLPQTAAAAAVASPAQPSTVKDNSIHSPHRQKKSKMSEAQKSSKVAIKKMEDDLPPPPAVGSVQVVAPGGQDLNALPVPPPKQAFSKFYQQRQVNELKRLYRHMHPELRKNLEEAVTEDLAEMLNTEDPNAQGSVNLDKVLPGEVQSMRWIFENWALDSIGDHQATKKLTEEEIIPSGDVKSTSLRFESQSINGYNLTTSAKVSETDFARGDVRTARWLFETQPLDTLNKLYSDETEVQEAVLKEPVQGGDVKGAKQLFEAQSLDAIGRCSSVEEKSILQLKSEIQELKGDVKKTVRLFQTEPLCAIRDKSGTIHEIKSVCREEIQSNAVRTARWLFETQPLDTINKDTSKVQIIRGISLEEIGRPDVSGARWIFETQPLDAIREITVEEQDFKASTDFVTGADVTKQRLLFETQTLDSLKGEASESVAAKEQVIGGDVKSTLWLFETQPMETLKDNFEVGRLTKVELSAEEKGDVKQRKHVFETCPLGSISKAFEEEIPATSMEEVVKGDVKSFKTLFETLPLDSIKQADAEPTTKEEEEKIPAGNVKANQILFETTPLYAIKDSFGNFHEVTSVSREQIISGDVKNYKWMFETRPLDQFDESIKKVDIIRGITKQEVVAGDVRTAKWLFETQPMDVIHLQATEGEKHPSVKREISQKGDVKTCRWLFETQPMHTLYEKAEKKQEEDGSVPQADVKSYTWMFETQPLDSLKGQEEQYLQVSKAYSQEELQGVDVKTVRHLFETEPLGSSTASEADRKKTMRYSSRVEFQSGEVSRVKEFFEAKPLDTATKPKSQKDAGTIEAGSVHKFTWLFENYPMDTLKDSSEGIQEIPPEKDVKGGDVGGKRFVFETYSLDQIHDKVDETELQKIQKDTMSKANVKSCTMLFESQPLYAIQDKEGGYHEVTSVQKEEIMKGDMKGARWLFETKPLDQIKKEEEVFVIRAVTQEDIKKGDVQTARWRFETEPLDSFSGGKLSVPRTVDDVQKGDVQSNKQLFESQQVGQKKYVRMVSVSDVQRGDVRTSTWLFENHPVDSLYGDAERSSSMSTVQREDSQKGDVKRCTWLFETQPMDTLKDTEVTASAGAQEEIPRADVKSTTWLFESTPLDKFSASEGSIEIELKERTMKETLETLCTCQAIQHDGILIEANDVESVKMVKYQLSSPGAPEILKEEIVGGHLQRIMLQLLHRTNVEAQSMLVEEDREGKIKVSPLQLLDQSEANKGKEDLSGDVAKALQGLLSQDSSIKKGMVLQETKSGSVKMTLYSLLFHSVQQKVVKGDVKSTIGNLLASSQEQKAAATIKREDNEKGNVQLFASCIEKGDLSYLRNLQQESEIQSLISAQAEEGADESSPRVVLGANMHVLPNKEQMEKVIAGGEPGAVEGAKKGFVCESTGREGVLEREAVHAAGVTGTTVQCLGKSLPTAMGKEEVLSGGLKVTTKSIQRVADASKKAEKEEATTAHLKEPKTMVQGTFPTQVTAQRAEVDGKQQSVVSGQASQTQTEEKALGTDLQAAMQSLRLATAEAKNIQHHVQSKFQRNREEVHTACRQQTVSSQGTTTLQSTVHQQDSSSTKQESSSTATRTTTTRVQEASKTHTSMSQKSIASHKKAVNSLEEHQQGNSRQLKCPDREAETPAQEKPAVVMREKKKRETEDERRKRLSVHKEEIMKGNVKEAMEIFENLRRQEQLQEILTRVREFEEETSKVDVKALKSFFEKVPEWVVRQKARQQDKAEAKEDADSAPSVDLVFEDLERASAEILHLKEQTLARIQDIEEAIKKAIYSVSSLKSESDIAGLSGLFKESLGSAQSSVSSSNIRKISIVSSKARQEEVVLETGEAASVESAKVAEKTEAAKAELEVPRLVQPRVSSPSSPSYITIESAARKPAESARAAHSPPNGASPDCLDSPGKRDAFAQNSFSSYNHPSAGSAGHDKKPLEKRPDPVQTKAGLGSMKQHTPGNANHPGSDKEKGSVDSSKESCHCGVKGSFSEYRSLNVASPQNPRRQKSILELQTGPDGSKLYGATRTVMEQYEEMDQFGNKIITSSTTVTKQSETQTSSTCDVVSHPRYEVSASPVFRRYLKSPGEDFHTNGSFQEPGVVFVTFGNSKPKK